MRELASHLHRKLIGFYSRSLPVLGTFTLKNCVMKVMMALSGIGNVLFIHVNCHTPVKSLDVCNST